MAGNPFASMEGALAAEVGDFLLDIVKSAVTKAADGLVAKGTLSPADETVFVEGILVDCKVGMNIYEQSQDPPT
jgi:polyhydroxyalkanoate synthesis regulator phasin